jgi:DNA-binding CsgD family transcriptional regulator
MIAQRPTAARLKVGFFIAIRQSLLSSGSNSCVSQNESNVRLTPRERECLSLVAQHMRTKQIARTLGTSPHTVDRQIATACKKLGAPDRMTAVQMLRQSGDLEDMLENPVDGSSGMETPPGLGPDDVSTETQDHARNPRNPELHLERSGARAERAGGRTGPEGDAAFSGVGHPQAKGVSDAPDAAEGDFVGGRLSGGQPLPAGDRFAITRYGYFARLGIIALIAVVSALLVAGVLVSADAALESMHRIFGES